MTYHSRIDLGVAAVVIAIGAVFAFEGWQIDPASHEAVGPRAVPLFLAIAMILLGGGIGLRALFGSGDDAQTGADFGFRDSDVIRVIAVVGAGAIYVFAFWALGYFVSSVIATVLALWIFGVRSPFIILVVAVVAGVLYQFVFMGMMGLLDPRGELVDLRWLSRMITPGS